MKKRRLLMLVTVLLAIALAVVYMKLPDIIAGVARTKLAAAGATDIELEFAETGTQRLRIDKLAFGLERDNSRYRVSSENIEASYTLTGLFAGQLDTLTIPVLSLAVNRQIPPAADTASTSIPSLPVSPTELPGLLPFREMTIGKLDIAYTDSRGEHSVQTPVHVVNDAGRIAASFDILVDEQPLRHLELQASDEGTFALTVASEAESAAGPYLRVQAESLASQQGTLQGELGVEVDLAAVSRELEGLGYSMPIDISGRFNGRGQLLLPPASVNEPVWQPRGDIVLQVPVIGKTAKAIRVDTPLSLSVSRQAAVVEPGKGGQLSASEFRTGKTVVESPALTLNSRASCRVEFTTFDWSCKPFATQLAAQEIRQGQNRIILPTGNTRLVSAKGNKADWQAGLVVDLPGLLTQLGKADAGKSIKLGQLHGRVEASNKQLKASLDVQLPGGAGSGHVDVTHSLQAKQGHAEYRLQPVNMVVQPAVFAETYSAWPPKLLFNSGKISAQGRINWRNGKLSEAKHSTITLDSVGGQYGDIVFAGLDTVIDVQGVEAPRISTSQAFRLATLYAGTPITAISAQAEVLLPHNRRPLVSLESVEMAALGGRLSSAAIRLDLSRERNPFSLDVEGVDIEKLLKLEQQQGMYGTGIIDGKLPLVLTADGISMENGKLAARQPGGKLVYTPTEGVKGMAKKNVGVNLLLTAMQDFNYKVLEADAFYTPNGLLKMHVHLEGSNPELEGGRPVHLNIAVEDNVLELLRSLRLASEISEKIGEQVQQRGKLK